EKLAEIGPCLSHHRILQVGAEFGIKLSVRVRRRNEPQLEPLAEEIFDEPLRLRVLQEALAFGAEHGPLTQVAGIGAGSELLIRQRAPKEIGKTAGQGMVVERAGRFDVIEKIGRTQGGA